MKSNNLNKTIHKNHPGNSGDKNKRFFLVVSEDADTCFYNETTDTCIDPKCITIIDEVKAISKQEAIKLVRERWGIPDWISLYCYPFSQ